MLVGEHAGQRPAEGSCASASSIPLGMRDTGFSVPAASLDRFGPALRPGPRRAPMTSLTGSGHARRLSPSGGDELVSTIDDYLAFARMLRAGGADGGPRPRPTTVETMTTNQIGDVAASGPDPSGRCRLGLRRGRAADPHRSQQAGRQLRLGRRARQLVGQRSVRGPDRHRRDESDVDLAGPTGGVPGLLDERLRCDRRLNEQVTPSSVVQRRFGRLERTLRLGGVDGCGLHRGFGGGQGSLGLVRAASSPRRPAAAPSRRPRPPSARRPTPRRPPLRAASARPEAAVPRARPPGRRRTAWWWWPAEASTAAPRSASSPSPRRSRAA